MQFVFGTGNQAKLAAMREMLADLPLEIIDIGSVGKDIPQVDESGQNPLENATIKAMAYYSALKIPVFSCDSGLFIEGLDACTQPGVHVRTVGGKYLSDDEMITHYSALAAGFGGFCRAVYKNAICLVYDETHIYKCMGDDLSGEAFLLSSRPHPTRRQGYPLDSLSVDITTGKYYHDLDKRRSNTAGTGFVRFFEGVLAEIPALP